jgi:Tfp pilus assembly protein PilO
MAALDGFARMPTQRKVAVFVVVGLLLGLLYWQFAYKSLARQVSEADAAHKRDLDQNAQYERDIHDYEVLKTQMTSLNHTLEDQEKALPTAAELPAFFETLNRKVLESGVEVRSSQREKEEKVENFWRVPVTFEISGTFMQIKKFFASLVAKKHRSDEEKKPGDDEVDDRIVSIENLTLNDPQVINHELVLHAKFTAMTYRQEEAATPPPGAAGKPASGAATPPADTPAGAKARTDNAMDKDSTRSGSGKLKEGM